MNPHRSLVVHLQPPSCGNLKQGKGTPGYSQHYSMDHVEVKDNKLVVNIPVGIDEDLHRSIESITAIMTWSIGVVGACVNLL